MYKTFSPVAVAYISYKGDSTRQLQNHPDRLNQSGLTHILMKISRLHFKPFKPGTSDLARNCAILNPNDTNKELFRIIFQCISAIRVDL